MKTYRVTVTREITQTYDLEIEAEDEADARDQANDEILSISAGDWSDLDAGSDPEIVKVVELTDDGDEATDDEDDEDAK